MTPYQLKARLIARCILITIAATILVGLASTIT